MVSGPHLVAHVVSGEATFDIAHPNEDGSEWHTSNGWRVWPYWNMSLGALMHDSADAELIRTVDDVPSIPDGWMEHLADEARKYAAAKPSPKEPKLDILKLMGIRPSHPSVSGTIKRRI